jgi:hypothetical protein
MMVLRNTDLKCVFYAKFRVASTGLFKKIQIPGTPSTPSRFPLLYVVHRSSHELCGTTNEIVYRENRGFKAEYSNIQRVIRILAR